MKLSLTKQKIRVTKLFTFDMAHALYGYDGPCKNIHGHTYHLEVTLIGYPYDDSTKEGMVIDFGDLKKIVKREIVEKFDHALVLNESAPYVTSELLNQEFENVIIVPYQPTCENLLLQFLENIKNLFPKEVQLCKVVLRETPTSFAEWQMEDN
ncbi:MAG: 6-carboxytetrahydropterin synthase [Saprospiraceae bacterium]|jgi:6-pyruvoyltetrahydropterin/6-carboxytetrahydropterin synthase|nr:6-carboxytetrahydropterin synthase [Saprospiraceae bacterium]